MKITTEQWKAIRQAVEADDVDEFQKLVREFARIAVGEERAHQRVCDRVRSRERGEQPFFAFDR